MRYIDADKIGYHFLHVAGHPVPEMLAAEFEINAIPTADVTKVKHGKWLCNIDFPIMQAMIRCSLCDEPSITMSKYYPNCGAKMDLEEKNDGEGSN